MSTPKPEKSTQQKFLDFVKLDFDNMTSFDEVLTSVDGAPKKQKNMKEWELKLNTIANKKNLKFYNEKTWTIFNIYNNNSIQIRTDVSYQKYNFSNFFDVKSLSLTSFKLTDNDDVNDLGHLLVNFQFMQKKLKELGIVDYILSICSNMDLDFKDTYNCYIADDEDEEPFLYTKIKFANKADAAMFSFTYQSMKSERDEDYD